MGKLTKNLLTNTNLLNRTKKLKILQDLKKKINYAIIRLICSVENIDLKFNIKLERMCQKQDQEIQKSSKYSVN